MKYSNIAQKFFIYQLFLIILVAKSDNYKNKFFPSTPVLNEIYIQENDKSYILVLEFSGTNFDYVTNETFAPPSLSLLFKNVKWGKETS